jgi:hypothetical protein
MAVPGLPEEPIRQKNRPEKARFAVRKLGFCGGDTTRPNRTLPVEPWKGNDAQRARYSLFID